MNRKTERQKDRKTERQKGKEKVRIFTAVQRAFFSTTFESANLKLVISVQISKMELSNKMSSRNLTFTQNETKQMEGIFNYQIK